MNFLKGTPSDCCNARVVGSGALTAAATAAHSGRSVVVLEVDHEPIAGLFAAGNTTGNAYAAGCAGAGATLRPIMTVGCFAGQTLAGEPAGYQPDAVSAKGARA
jgi:3-oxosteroid 1-dehydrogenase